MTEDTTDAIRARLDALVIRRDYYAETHAMQVDRAVRAVLDVHPALKWYEDCASDEDTAEGCSVPYDEHFYVGDDGIWTCEASRVQDVCAHCTNDDHERRVNFPCPTLTAIATALGVTP